jgi:hypothetical protein
MVLDSCSFVWGPASKCALRTLRDESAGARLRPKLLKLSRLSKGLESPVCAASSTDAALGVARGVERNAASTDAGRPPTATYAAASGSLFFIDAFLNVVSRSAWIALSRTCDPHRAHGVVRRVHDCSGECGHCVSRVVAHVLRVHVRALGVVHLKEGALLATDQTRQVLGEGAEFGELDQALRTRVGRRQLRERERRRRAVAPLHVGGASTASISRTSHVFKSSEAKPSVPSRRSRT